MNAGLVPVLVPARIAQAGDGMKEILVCLDGSRSSRRALEMALGVARHWGATLVGMAIIISPSEAGDARQAAETGWPTSPPAASKLR